MVSENQSFLDEGAIVTPIISIVLGAEVGKFVLLDTTEGWYVETGTLKYVLIPCKEAESTIVTHGMVRVK